MLEMKDLDSELADNYKDRIYKETALFLLSQLNWDGRACDICQLSAVQVF